MFDITDEKKAILCLAQIEMTNKKKHRLLDKAENKSRLFNDKIYARKIFSNIDADKHFEKFQENCQNVDEYILTLDKLGCEVVSYLDKHYPQKLLEIDDYPVLLFLKGNTQLLHQKSIGVVGTRIPTKYGLRIVEDFTRSFAREDLVVVSGFARGVDTLAHKTTIQEGGATIAVFGCGLNVCYPAENRALYDKLLQSGGLIVTEYPLDSRPTSYHFPERNRIISGLSDGVFLAEAKENSGSLITINYALEQGKEVFIVPADINKPSSEGSNRLLKSGQCALVLSPDDVFFGLGMTKSKNENKEEALQLDFLEQKIVDLLYQGETHFEELLKQIECSANELSSALINLEIFGVVDKLSGNYYVLCN